MIESKLGQDLATEFSYVSGRRQGYEQGWLKDLRQYKGIYDPEILAKLELAKRSQAFIRETRTKIRTLDARIMDLLFPANGEKNWEIQPTPNPEFLPQEERNILAQLQQLLAQSGEQRTPTRAEFDMAKRNVAKETTIRMSAEIADQLAEIKYRNIIRNVMHSGHLYGTGWLKGPLVDQATTRNWKRTPVFTTGADGAQVPSTAWRIVKKPVLKPYAQFRPIWNVFPDLSVTELDECRYVYERHMMPQHKLVELANRPDFNGAMISEYLSDHPKGDAKYSTFESELFSLKSFDMAPYPSVGMYQLLEYWGIVTLEQLLNLGVPQESLQDDYFFCNIWLIDEFVIKMANQPIEGLSLPYYAYYFDKDETSIYGEGVATIMRDPQRLTNAAVRAMVDNAAHCAGPQYEVNVDLLAEGEDPTDVGAFKVWMRTGRDADIAGKEVVRVKQISSYTPEFMQMWNVFSKAGDEVTIIPRYLQGDSRVSGAGRTASGLSMLMGQANVGLSDLVKIFDDGITKPFIEGMYNWNMQFNPKEDIKGDMTTVARGSTALMAKEIRAQRIEVFLRMTQNNLDAPWIKRGELLAEWADATDIGRDAAVRTQQEFEDYMAQQTAAQNEANQQAVDRQLAIKRMELEQEQQFNTENKPQLNEEAIMNAINIIGARLARLEQALGQPNVRNMRQIGGNYE